MPPLLPLLLDDDDSNVVTVCIDKSFTDGDSSVWPTHPRYEREDPQLYLRKLAQYVDERKR
ncbi:predicted protein [Histoplasma mississippiense (nom. inval.)]|uniref:predicted protein n=1 Tax=Ajellomyces capsulatus (strain NAm1 / WU24) TaxID=2059318 RepID=UPI000157C5EC|nr:predicted protein [Histoplasma mississippiense (nom. inval.)]EDN08306.1 predicted protein [Histoplasma mississippiense (nom. inval.)]